MSANFSAWQDAPSRLRILVADDNEVFLAAVSRLLRRLGHRVESVSSGREAVRAAMADEYDIILIDMLMPELGGVEAARRIRERLAGGRSPFIIGLSAEGDPEAFPPSTGMDEFLAKPIALSDLDRVLGHSVGC
jgi:CheY-like chemotaxis protein